MKITYLACLAVAAAGLAVTAASAVPASAHVNETARVVVDGAVPTTRELMPGTHALSGRGLEPNRADFARTAARNHTPAKPLELRPRQTKAPCPDPKKYAPGC